MITAVPGKSLVMLVGRRPAAFGGGLLLAVAAILVVVAANRPIARPFPAKP